MTRKYLITPKEALTLADKVLTTREMQWAHALHVEYIIQKLHLLSDRVVERICHIIMILL